MIGLYCPDVPPIPGGVADHTLHLARALERRGIPLAVLARRGDPAGFAPLPVRMDVTPPGLRTTVRALGLRGLYVQYVPFLYARFGIAPALPAALAGLRRDGVTVGLFVHEPYVPFTRLPWLVTGVPQRLQLRRLVRAAHHVYAATPAFAAICRRLARGADVALAPIGTTIPLSTLSRPDARRALGLTDGIVAIGVFSPAASGYRVDWVRSAMNALAARADVRWIVFGSGSDRAFPGAPANVRALGRLPVEAAADTARALDLFVAPYDDGLSMRRSGAMLGLANALPVVSSTGPLFDPAFTAYAACEPSAAAFTARVVGLVDDAAARAALAEQARGAAGVATVDALADRLVRDLAA